MMNEYLGLTPLMLHKSRKLLNGERKPHTRPTHSKSETNSLNWLETSMTIGTNMQVTRQEAIGLDLILSHVKLSTKAFHALSSKLQYQV